MDCETSLWLIPITTFDQIASKFDWPGVWEYLIDIFFLFMCDPANLII